MHAKHDAQPEVVVITGASAGVGRATARDEALTTQKEAESIGGTAVFLPLDVADADKATLFGGIDTWISNTMVSVLSPVKDMQFEEFRSIICCPETKVRTCKSIQFAALDEYASCAHDLSRDWGRSLRLLHAKRTEVAMRFGWLNYSAKEQMTSSK